MANRFLFPLLVLLSWIVSPVSGRGQAAAEYGMAAGAASATTSSATSAVNNSLRQAGERLPQASPGKAQPAAPGTTAPTTSAATTAPGTAAPGQPGTTASPAPSTTAPIATKTLETVMKENLEKLRPKAGQGAATLRIDSVPAQAKILIDGVAVGYTPLELELPSGRYLAELKQTDSLPWSKEVSLNPGETVSLEPVLQYKYPSVVTLSSWK